MTQSQNVDLCITVSMNHIILDITCKTNDFDIIYQNYEYWYLFDDTLSAFVIRFLYFCIESVFF